VCVSDTSGGVKGGSGRQRTWTEAATRTIGDCRPCTLPPWPVTMKDKILTMMKRSPGYYVGQVRGKP
jgi:hypothetical protein